MITISEDHRNRRVISRIKRSGRHVRDGIRSGYFRLGQDLRSEGRRLVREPPKTGRVYRIRGRLHQASAPGQPPANLTGLLQRSIDFEQRGWDQMLFGARAEYAPYLELGTSRIDPRPFLRPAVSAMNRNGRRHLEREVEASLKRRRIT